MANASISTEVIAAIASLSLLAPLVRAIHKWHVDIRKTSKSVAEVTPPQSQTSIASQGTSKWSRMSSFERWAVISNFITFLVCGVALLGLVLFAPTTPASSKEVAVVGLLVCMVVLTSRFSNEA